MSTLVVVSTCPRQPSYLGETVRSLDAAGATTFERWILWDTLPDVDSATLEVPGWTSGRSGRSRTSPSSRNNLWGAFRLAAQRKASRLLFFEDDIIACRNAVRRMAEIEIPADCSMMTFHDVKEKEPGAAPGVYVTRDMHGSRGLGLWGIQALALPARTCEYLAAKDPFAVWKSSQHRHGDRTLEHYLSVSRWPRYAIHIPCLVQHVGAASAVEPGKSLELRQTSNWPGEDHDALGMA